MNPETIRHGTRHVTTLELYDLRDQATAARDTAQVARCNDALAGDPDAIRDCWAAIGRARLEARRRWRGARLLTGCALIAVGVWIGNAPPHVIPPSLGHVVVTPGLIGYGAHLLMTRH